MADPDPDPPAPPWIVAWEAQAREAALAERPLPTSLADAFDAETRRQAQTMQQVAVRPAAGRKTFHARRCGSAKLGEPMTIADALGMGMVPCSRCFDADGRPKGK